MLWFKFLKIIKILFVYYSILLNGLNFFSVLCFIDCRFVCLFCFMVVLKKLYFKFRFISDFSLFFLI